MSGAALTAHNFSGSILLDCRHHDDQLFLSVGCAPDPTVQLHYLPPVLPNVGDYVFDEQGREHKVPSRPFHIGKDIYEIYINC
jgi:hypothetical protein